MDNPSVEKKNEPTSTPKIAPFDFSRYPERAFLSRAAKQNFPMRHVDTYLRGDCEPEMQLRVELETDKIGEGYIVALLGPRGTGKTQAAVNILCHALWRERSTDSNHPRQPIYVKCAEIFREIRATYLKKSDASELDMYRRFTTCSLLVVDETHERGDTDFEDRTLGQIIDKRYDMMVDTLLISNLTRDAFGKALGPSVVSRLHECGKVIEFTGKSFRE